MIFFHDAKFVRFTCPGITSLGTELMPKVRGSLDWTHQPCKTTSITSVHIATADTKHFDAYNNTSLSTSSNFIVGPVVV